MEPWVGSETMASLVDAIICRNASWFAGWSGSTYSRLLGLYRHVDHSSGGSNGAGGNGSGFHVVCPGFACLVRTGGVLLRHIFCQEAARRPRLIVNAASTVRATGSVDRFRDVAGADAECSLHR